MKPKSLLLCIVSLSAALFLCGSRAWGFNEPEDFKGVKWGASRAETKKIIQSQWDEQGLKPAGYSQMFKITDTLPLGGLGGHATVSFEDNIGAAKNVLFIMHFIDDQFSAVELSFYAVFYSAIEGAFVARYGQPDSTVVGEVQNRAGAKFANPTSTWRGKILTASTTKYFSTMTHGLATLGRVEYWKLKADELDKKYRAGAKDL